MTKSLKTNYLLVDIGSTYTKLTAVNLEEEDIIATSQAHTTILDDVHLGYQEALDLLLKDLPKDVVFEKIFACSSAAGGLKMAAIGLVEELTVEAAKRVCLNSGGKVDLIFSHYLTKSDIEKIKDGKIDIILLAGGTDGGNSEVVIHNLGMLARAGVKIPIIYAGNKSAQDEVLEIFEEYKLNGHICANVMPKLNELNIDPAKEVIKKIFLENIIEAKGIKVFSKKINGDLLPTPQVVLKAIELLSVGYLGEVGFGDSVLIDIGGATTDIYSISKGLPKTPNTIVQGLEEPFAKRTVEGDLGMRYSAGGIVDSLNKESLEKYKLAGIDLVRAAEFRLNNVEFIPNSSEEKKIDTELAKISADTAFSRHVGTTEAMYTPVGVIYAQRGKDLSETKTIIGTGGVIIKNDEPVEILKEIQTNLNKPLELRPKDANFYLDSDYILSAMGLLSFEEPMLALKIMKKRIKRI